jgi:hypothetical protein
VHRKPEEHVCRRRRDIDVDPERTATVLGGDLPVMKPGGERRKPLAVDARGLGKA